MLTFLALLTTFVLQDDSVPDISGVWTGEAPWGQVTLTKSGNKQLAGEFGEGGSIELRWNDQQSRYTGNWTIGSRGGDLSVRVIDNELRGAYTDTSGSDSNLPTLSDFLWRVSKPDPTRLSMQIDDLPQRVIHFDSSARHRLAVSPDGKLVAMSNSQPTLIMQAGGVSRVKDNWKPIAELRDAKSGDLVASLELSTAEERAAIATTPRVSHFRVTALAFSPSGRHVAVGTSIGQIKVYNTKTGELLLALDDELERLKDAQTPEQWQVIRRALGSVNSIAFSPDGTKIAACGTSFADFSEVFQAFDRMGISATGPGRLKVWEAANGELMHDLPGHSAHVHSVAFTKDGLLASGGSWFDRRRSGTGMLLWDATTGKMQRRFDTRANGGTHALAVSPDGKLAVIGSVSFDKNKDRDAASTMLHIVRTGSGLLEWNRKLPGFLRNVQFTPDGKNVLVLSSKKGLESYRIDSGVMNREISSESTPFGGSWISFDVFGDSKNATVAISASSDDQKGRVEFWPLTSK